jgi:putative transcriptional regulator
MMAVSYKKLLHMLIDKNMTIADLQKQAGYSANISTRLRNDTYISLESVEKICRVLECKMDEIIEFVPNSGEEVNL